MLEKDLLSLKGLRAAPSQICGAFRLVPLIRESVCDDVRIHLDKYKDEFSEVRVDSKFSYWSFIPHGMLLEWGEESNLASLGAQLKKAGPERTKCSWGSIQTFHKMAKTVGKNALRFLPLHLSMEYFLGLCFGGPKIRWPEYSAYVKRYGLGFRIEFTQSGRSLFRFDEALRQFEIHEGQVGVLVYTAEELASAFVVPTPGDYRRMHESLLMDFYGYLIYQYAILFSAQKLNTVIDASKARSIDDLRAALLAARADWAEFSTKGMAEHLIEREIEVQTVFEPPGLKLQRFMTELDLNRTNTIGERLLRENGEVLYLKTYRLDADQAKRAWLLKNLAKNEWNLQRTAATLRVTMRAFVSDLEESGFAYLLADPEQLKK